MYGDKIYSIAYANNKLYLINGHDENANMYVNRSVRGFIIDINTSVVISQFGSENNMERPHDIAVSSDEREIYVVELDNHKVYKFNQGKI